MSLQLTDDDFALFGLPQRFEQDDAVIAERWRALLRQAHPDRFAAHGEAAQRLAMQWSVRINEAYQRLRDPVRRAAALCARRGVPVDPERDTAMPGAFLAQMLAWREALEDARDATAVQTLADTLGQARRVVLGQVAEALDVRQDAPAAAQAVRELMFIERLARDVDARLDSLTAIPGLPAGQ